MSGTEIPDWVADQYKKFFEQEKPVRFLRLKEVVSVTGIGASQIYRLQSRGEFPKGVKLSKSTVAWVESEVQEWCRDRIKAARSK